MRGNHYFNGFLNQNSIYIFVKGKNNIHKHSSTMNLLTCNSTMKEKISV